MDFANIVLRIAIRVKDEVLARTIETGNQGRAVAEISLVMDDAQIGQFRGEAVQKRPRLILASIIDDNDLELAGHLAHLGRNRAHDSLDGVLVVIGWE